MVFAVFRDEGGIVVKIEFESETAGHDSCAMRAMDGVSSLAALFFRRDKIRLARSEGDTSFPGNEIFLRFQLSLGAGFATGDGNYKIENAFADLFDCRFAGNNGAGINVNDVGHARGQG